jgi:hypothetical protein
MDRAQSFNWSRVLRLEGRRILFESDRTPANGLMRMLGIEAFCRGCRVCGQMLIPADGDDFELVPPHFAPFSCEMRGISENHLQAL